MKLQVFFLLLPSIPSLSFMQHFCCKIAAQKLAIVRQVANAHPAHWARGSRAAPNVQLTLRVALHPHKSDAQLHDIVLAVTDPASPLYGHYLTSQEQLQTHFQPSKTSVQSFLQVLQETGEVQVKAMDRIHDFWRVQLSAATAERLFSAKMYHYTHRLRSELSVVRPHANFSFPRELDTIVAYVDGLESFPTETQASFLKNVEKEDHPSEFQNIVQGATPAVIRQQYDIPNAISINTSNILATRTNLVVGTFLHESYNAHDLQQFLRTVDGQQEPLKMPQTRGPCTSESPTGEASLDVQVVAALTRQGEGDASSIEMVCYTQLRDPTRQFAADNQEPFLTFVRDVNAMDPPPAVVSMSYSDDECGVPLAYATTVNRELMKAALRGSSILVSAGDNGVRGSKVAQAFCKRASCTHFMTMFPASSPYVTAVGATTIAIDATAGHKRKETVTSTRDPRVLITSGGGFSDLFDMPQYQHDSVASYVAFANATGLTRFFRATGRALPDVAAVGHAFPVVINGKVTAMDGTSVSAPVVASMILLLNRALPHVSPLGFLNPLLYRLHDVCPQVFADITHGDIACGAKGMACCTRGHHATTGWDAASGLGTLRFATLLTDLPECLTRMKTTRTTQLATMFLEEESKEDVDTKWTFKEHPATQIVGVSGVIGAISLIAVFVSKLVDRFGSKRYKSCAQNDSAREYLLSH